LEKVKTKFERSGKMGEVVDSQTDTIFSWGAMIVVWDTLRADRPTSTIPENGGPGWVTNSYIQPRAIEYCAFGVVEMIPRGRIKNIPLYLFLSNHVPRCAIAN
jgi:hypothetical protein